MSIAYVCPTRQQNDEGAAAIFIYLHLLNMMRMAAYERLALIL